MDINLPGMDGIKCVRELKAKMPKAQFVMLTVYEDSNRLFKSLVAGASGYLLKRTTPSRLLAAIREAHQGGSPMTPQIARLDRKSTRLNSSHLGISYAVFCLKKK